jgi:quinol monooxygenase YgiN
MTYVQYVHRKRLKSWKLRLQLSGMLKNLRRLIIELALHAHYLGKVIKFSNFVFYKLSNFKNMKISIILSFLCYFLFVSTPISAQTKDMMIRIAELEIDSNYLQEYNAILQEESRASVLLEQGVIVIFPMYQKESPTQIRLLEIYANRAAYEAHLKTPHFLKYKTSTKKMVKSLKLIDMDSLDPQTMGEIFRKMKQ